MGLNDVRFTRNHPGGFAVICRFDAHRCRCSNVSGCHGDPKAEWSDSHNGPHGSLMCDEMLRDDEGAVNKKQRYYRSPFYAAAVC